QRFRGRLGNSGGAEDERMHLPAALRIGRRAGRGVGLEGYGAELSPARFRKGQHVGHQITFASVLSSRTSSGTASGPSPTMRPPLRSGGSESDSTSSRDSPSWAGRTSIVFFLAAMIPLSDGSRGRAIPSSIVSTAGS